MEESSEEDTELKKEIEIALYSQIHFQENHEYDLDTKNDKSGTSDDFKIKVIGNYKVGFKAQSKTSDILLNRSINYSDNEAECLYDEIGFDNQEIIKTSNHDSDLDSLYCLLDTDHVDDLPGLQLNVTRNQRPLLDSHQHTVSATATAPCGRFRVHRSGISFDSNSSVISDRYIDNTSEKWKINLDDQRQRKEGFRYHKGYRCFNCNEVGHLSKNCPKPKKVTVCSFCSEPGHFMMKCPSSLCYNCNDMGHDAKSCPRPRKSIHNECHRCSMVGHNKAACPDQWRQYHHTISAGEIVQGTCKEAVLNYCYNCAGDDHLGHECDEERMNRHTRVTLPFICHYDDDRFFSYSTTRDDEDEPPRKRQKIEASLISSKRLSKHIINTKQHYSGNTGRNNFDKLMADNSHVKSKKKRNKKKSWKRTNRDETDCDIILDERNKKRQKINFEEEDFPRNINNTVNNNGFRSRFASMNSHVRFQNFSNLTVTVNSSKEIPSQGSQNASTVKKSKSGQNGSNKVKVSKKKKKKELKN